MVQPVFHCGVGGGSLRACSTTVLHRMPPLQMAFTARTSHHVRFHASCEQSGLCQHFSSRAHRICTNEEMLDFTLPERDAVVMRTSLVFNSERKKEILTLSVPQCRTITYVPCSYHGDILFYSGSDSFRNRRTFHVHFIIHMIHSVVHEQNSEKSYECTIAA